MTKYNEVKRRANVGERVRVFGHCVAEANGEFTTYRAEKNGDIMYKVGKGRSYGTPYYDGRAYVVLEPVAEPCAQPAIDGRKATVTDRDHTFNTYDTFAEHHGCPDAASGYVPKDGEEVTLLVSGAHLSLYCSYPLWIVENSAGKRFIVGEPGLRIHPQESAQPSDPTTPQLPELFAEFIRQNAEAVRAYLDSVDASVSPAPVDPMDFGYEPEPSAKPTETTTEAKPLTRSDVIAQARADVAELIRIGTDKYANVPGPSPLDDRYYSVNLYVNREKRTVTAVVNTTDSGGNICNRGFAKGIARCAPDDVFHADIGKAIALRRALGLAVPDEYLRAPKPEKAETGAKVYTASSYGVMTVATETTISRREISATCFESLGHCERNGDPAILDDTDVDYSAQ